MFKEKKVSVVIPVHNEEKSIKSVLVGMPKFIDEIVIVDNASTDRTQEICKSFNAKIAYEKRKGYGFAYHKGFAEASGDIIIAIDGDDTYPLSELPKILAFFESSKCDFVSGCRISPANKGSMLLISKVGNALISMCIRIFFKINLIDSQSGLWVFRKEILPKIQPYSEGMSFSQEIKIRAWANPDIKCSEINILYQKRANGKSKFRRLSDSFVIMRNFFDLLKKFYNYHKI